MNQKGFAPILIILIVAVAASVGGFLVYQQSKSKLTPIPSPQRVSQPSPTPDANREPTGSAETANWKTYTNEKYNFTIKYSPYLNPKEKPSSDRYLFEISFVDYSEDNLTGFTVAVHEGKLEDVVQSEKRLLIGHVVDSIKTETKIRKAGHDGIKLEYEYQTGPLEKPRIDNKTIIVLASDEYVYTLGSQSDLMDQILSTFRFLP